MKNPSGNKINHIGDAYIDDTVFIVTHLDPDCPLKDVIQFLSVSIEEILQYFERNIYVTGGELALKQNFYHLIAWMWDKTGGAGMGNIQETPENRNKKMQS